MEVLLNGQSCDVPEGESLSTLLQQFGLSDRPVAVAVNGAVVPRSQHAVYKLSIGDEVELVRAVGGG